MTDPFRPPVLVHNCRRSCENVGLVFLRPDIQDEWDAFRNQNNAGNRRGMDDLLPLCNFFSSVAALVQLDSVRPNDELSSHVCPK